MHENQKKGGPRSRRASPWTFDKMFNESEYRGPTVRIGPGGGTLTGTILTRGKAWLKKTESTMEKRGVYQPAPSSGCRRLRPPRVVPRYATQVNLSERLLRVNGSTVLLERHTHGPLTNCGQVEREDRTHFGRDRQSGRRVSISGMQSKRGGRAATVFPGFGARGRGPRLREKISIPGKIFALIQKHF
jgi:hypothetical protein